MKKQQTVRGIPHWGKFKDAVRDMRVAAANLKDKGMLNHSEATDYLATTIEEGMKFYVPDVSNIISNKDLSPPFDGKEHMPFRLPYPVTILLSNCNLTADEDGTGITGDGMLVKYNKDWKEKGRPDKMPTHKISILAQMEQQQGDLSIKCASVVYAPYVKTWICLPVIVNFSFRNPVNESDKFGYTVSWNPDKYTAAYFEHLFNTGMSEDEADQLRDDYYDDFISMATLCKLLEINDCKQVPVNVPPKLAKKHAKRGETGNYDYKVLSIGGEVWDSPYLGGGNGGGGGTKRSHMRRGHIRTYQTGKKVWINSTYVHGNKEGFVEKDYRLKGGGDAE